ncbi:MAG: IPT/TIG domain-containing protein, partial [Acidimicrobiia bacterium]
MTTSTHFADGDLTSNINPGLTDENTTFVAGQFKESTDETSGITLSATQFTEIEYAVQATASAISGATYCFRLTDAVTATNFTYTETTYGKVKLAGPPTVTSVVPGSGPTAGGTAVTITGTGFDSGVTNVTFGGVLATVNSVTSTTIDVTTPSHAVGTVDVTVTNPDTQSDTLTNGYAYTIAGLIAHWTFDDGSGQTALDVSGNGNDGTLGSDTGADANDPAWTCNTLGFNGTPDYVEVPHAANYLLDDATVAFWFKTPNVTTQQGLWSKDSSGNDTGG